MISDFTNVNISAFTAIGKWHWRENTHSHRSFCRMKLSSTSLQFVRLALQPDTWERTVHSIPPASCIYTPHDHSPRIGRALWMPMSVRLTFKILNRILTFLAAFWVHLGHNEGSRNGVVMMFLPMTCSTRVPAPGVSNYLTMFYLIWEKAKESFPSEIVFYLYWPCKMTQILYVSYNYAPNILTRCAMMTDLSRRRRH